MLHERGDEHLASPGGRLPREVSVIVGAMAYVDAWLKVVDWDVVERRFGGATTVAELDRHRRERGEGAWIILPGRSLVEPRG